MASPLEGMARAYSLAAQSRPLDSAATYLSRTGYALLAATAISAATAEPAKALVLDRGDQSVCRLVNPQDVTGITRFAEFYSLVSPWERGIAVRGKPYFGMLQESAPHILRHLQGNKKKIYGALSKIAGEDAARDFLDEAFQNYTNLGQGLLYTNGGNAETIGKKLEQHLTKKMMRKLKNSTGIECVLRQNDVREKVGIVFSTIVYGTVAGMAGGGSGSHPGAGPSPPPPVCFTADTKVLMADGRMKPIAKIKEGEKVQSFNFMTNRKVKSRVTRLFRARADSHLILNGALKVTEKHPFAVGMDSWKEAGELRKGDVVLGKKDVTLKSFRKVARSSSVFNLTVAGQHNYYVSDGKDDFLVHNKGPFGGCFIKGSLVKMANGILKKIENIKIGDKVKVWNTKTRGWTTLPVTEVQAYKNKFGYYAINKKLKVSPFHRLFVNKISKRAPELTLGDTLSNGRKSIRTTSIELVQKKADRHNIVLGRNADVAYLVDGFLVLNGW